MGLDIYFFAPGEDESLFWLRNHWDFFQILCDLSHEQVDDECSDFLVYTGTLQLLARRLGNLAPALDETKSSFDFEALCHDGDERLDTGQRLRFQQYLLQRLRAAVQQNGYLICSWSA